MVSETSVLSIALWRSVHSVKLRERGQLEGGRKGRQPASPCTRPAARCQASRRPSPSSRATSASRPLGTAEKGGDSLSSSVYAKCSLCFFPSFRITSKTAPIQKRRRVIAAYLRAPRSEVRFLLGAEVGDLQLSKPLLLVRSTVAM